MAQTGTGKKKMFHFRLPVFSCSVVQIEKNVLLLLALVGVVGVVVIVNMNIHSLSDIKFILINAIFL
jgi:hypothetical protein